MAKSKKKHQSKPDDFKAFEERQNRAYEFAKPLFWIFTVFGMIVGGVMVLISVFLTTVSETVGVIGQSSSAVTGFLLLLLGAALITDCYMLTKGIDPARLVYGVLMGIESLLVLALLMTGEIDMTEYPELAAALLIFLIPLVYGCVMMPTSKGIKEYMYDLEVSDIDKSRRR